MFTITEKYRAQISYGNVKNATILIVFRDWSKMTSLTIFIVCAHILGEKK